MNTEENNMNEQQPINDELGTTSNNISSLQNDKHQNNLLEELSNQKTGKHNTYTYDNSTNELKAIKKMNKWRLALEIAGILILLIALFSSSKKVSKEEYDSLNAKYKELRTYSNNIETEYQEYKSRMRMFENLSDEQMDALIADVDRIAAEKKAAEERAAAEKKAAEEKAAEEAEAKRKAEASATMEQKNALDKSKQYLKSMPFSYSGLLGQLKYEGFSDESATYAVDNCGADWNEQAAKKAQEYLDSMPFSRSELIGQLLYEGFTAEQAEYGVSSVGY